MPPSWEMVNGIQQHLRDKDIILEDDLVAVVAAATNEWIRSPDGAMHIMKLLEFDWRTAKRDQSYDLLDGFGAAVEVDIPADQVLVFSGIMVHGEPVPRAQLHAREITTLTCEGCAIIDHCVKTVIHPHTGKMVDMCNHCLICQEDLRLMQEGNSSDCETCPSLGCTYNPNRNISRIGLG